ncbi:Stp1/IreP family PP2C-type Ser/Thr phosphatase [Eubacterium sp. MSJ-13]|uniref:Stp1/IreP family PP2C-type Ser/Thr phosphatase n=1 Tax=Eubacterium sp. MSJ-13 TaxID=2841513 RepID=UPI001C10E69B|nr:Stp1/IreP family PP2C-type Ser/Thr phosphatase [Eubacterium sp. MSJ-13]MBU5479314.1 Stp1/IreP family PP2C-type Ser/Thr phosphatase [Eubacterium sp. MSJ-13]
MKAYAKTDIGSKRTMNQDSVYCNENSVGSFQNLFIVADGMGGHKAGDYASRLCVEKMVEAIEKSKSVTPVTILEEAVTEANSNVLAEAKTNVEYEGMGTTMVACTLQENTLYIANIGDSRLYIINDDIRQITKDHSWVEEMVKKGEITESQARIHPQKNIITRALGIDETVHADYFEVNVKADDKILMCSDGLTNMVEDDDIEYIVRHSSSVEKAVENLVEKANENGGKDNITVILVQI